MTFFNVDTPARMATYRHDVSADTNLNWFCRRLMPTLEVGQRLIILTVNSSRARQFLCVSELAETGMSRPCLEKPSMSFNHPCTKPCDDTHLNMTLGKLMKLLYSSTSWRWVTFIELCIKLWPFPFHWRSLQRFYTKVQQKKNGNKTIIKCIFTENYCSLSHSADLKGIY